MPARLRFGAEPAGATVRGMSPRHVPASVTELQRIGLFGSLPGETIAKLAERMVREEFAAGRAIVTEGESTDRFYVLLSGLAARDPGRARARAASCARARRSARWRP